MYLVWLLDLTHRKSALVSGDGLVFNNISYLDGIGIKTVYANFDIVSSFLMTASCIYPE